MERLPLSLFLLCAPGSLLAEVVFDGSIGPNASGTLRSGAFVIDQSDGEVVGANLFHSFSRFNVETGESATFSHADASVNNIIARVTLNEPSRINGMLQTQMGVGDSSANLWLLNPAGIFIGDGAEFNVQGTLNFASVNRLGFANGDDFYTHDINVSSTLSIAAPSEFGFLDDSASLPAGLQSQGIVAELTDPDNLNRTIDLGNVRLVGSSQLASQAGVRILGDVASSAEFFDAAFPPGTMTQLTVAQGDIVALGVDDLGQGGSYAIAELAAEAITGPKADITLSGVFLSSYQQGAQAGRLQLMGRNINLFNTALQAGSPGQPTADLLLTAQETFSAQDSPLFTFGGALHVQATDIYIQGTNNLGLVGSYLFDDIQARDIHLAATQRMELTDTIVRSENSGPGNAAGIRISSGDYRQEGGQLLALTDGPGDAGNIDITASQNQTADGNVHLLDGADIFLATLGSGTTGSLRVTADSSLHIHGSSQNRSSVRVLSNESNGGPVGDIRATAADIDIRDALIGSNSSSGDNTSPAALISFSALETNFTMTNSQIGSVALGLQDAADVSIFANNELIVTGNTTTDGQVGSPEITAIRSIGRGNSSTAGTSGSVFLEAGSIQLNQASVNVSQQQSRTGGDTELSLLANNGDIILDGADLFATTSGDADAADISVTAAGDIDITANSGGANINSNSDGANNPDAGGSAGDIRISGTNIRFQRDPNFAAPGLFFGSIRCPGACASSTSRGSAGNIEITASGLLQVEGNYSFLAELLGPSNSIANSGNISLNATDIHLNNSGGEFADAPALISSSTTTAGNAGNILLRADNALNVVGEFNITSNSTAFENVFDGGFGAAGSIGIEANSIHMESVESFISTATATSGDAGGIELSAVTTLELSGLKITSASTSFQSNAGSAGTIDLVGDNIQLTNSNVRTETISNNRSNRIASVTVEASGDLLLNNAVVAAQTLGSVDAGNIKLDAVNNMTLAYSAISSPSLRNDSFSNLNGIDSGSGGTIRIGSNGLLRDLNILGNTVIATSTLGTGNAGSITIDALNNIAMSRNAGDLTAPDFQILSLAQDTTLPVISSTSRGQGPAAGSAGNIQISSRDLALSQGVITVESNSGNMANQVGNIAIELSEHLHIQGETSIVQASSTSVVNGGDVNLRAATVSITESAKLSTNASGSGDSGNINIVADGLIVSDSASLETNAELGGGGNINLLIRDNLRLQNGQLLASSNSSTAAGDGGTISIGSADTPVDEMIIQGSMSASAVAGDGGRINIFANNLLRETSAQLLVTSQSGNAGQLEINAPEQDISAAINDLNVSFLNASDLLSGDCVSLKRDERSSLRISASNNIPGIFTGYQPSHFSGLGQRTAERDFQTENSELAHEHAAMWAPCNSLIEY